MILLAFPARALAVVGFLVSFRTFDSVDALDASTRFAGFLMTTVGFGIVVAVCRMAAKLGAAKGVEGCIGVFLTFFGLPAFLSLIISVWYRHERPGGLPPAGLIWFALAVLETMATLVWLWVRDKRAKRAAANIESQDESAAG